VYEMLDPGLLARLTAASHASGIEDGLRDLADDVASWDAEGLTAKQIDKRIRAWGREHGVTAEEFRSDVLKDYAGHEDLVSEIDFEKLWKAFGYEEWLIECVRSLAFTDEPIPFHPLAAGFWLPVPNADPPLLIGVMTPLSDPDLATRQVKEQFTKFYGKKAARKTKANEVERARMLAQYRRGMSHREIAIQNLRDRYPDIIHRPHKYKDKIETEKSRVAKELSVSDVVWKERGFDSSTPE
jgi:hypothetical protein